jgi:Ion channel
VTSSRPALWSRDRRHPGDRFGLLLLLLVISYVFSAFASGAWLSALQVALFAGVMLLAVRTGRVPRPAAQALVTFVLAGSAAAVTLALTSSPDVVIGVVGLWKALLLLFAVVIIVRRVLAEREVTIQSIYGAVSAYMIVGLMFASVYGAMYRFGGDAFFASGSPGNVNTFQYFSFTTLTTLGYGDFTAAENSGRAVAVLEALAGQIFLATLIARLVASFRGPRQREQAPPSPDGQSGDQAQVNSGRRPRPYRPRPYRPPVRRASSRARGRPGRSR